MTGKLASEDVRSSVLGARIFYAVMFGLFYLCVALYPNKLRTAIVDFMGSPFSNLMYLIYIIVLHVTSVWYFLTAGDNPGFVASSKTLH